MSRYETALGDVVLPAWLPFGAGEITALPLSDRRTGGFAHLSYRRALEAAALYSARLPTREEVFELHSIGLRLRPYVLPGALCLPRGTNEQAMRERHMASEAWARLHDSAVMAQLDALGWDGSRPVSNAGKHWIQPCPRGRGRLCGWFGFDSMSDPDVPIQAGTDPRGTHDDGHHDYATTTLLVRSA